MTQQEKTMRGSGEHCWLTSRPFDCLLSILQQDSNAFTQVLCCVWSHNPLVMGGMFMVVFIRITQNTQKMQEKNICKSAVIQKPTYYSCYSLGIFWFFFKLCTVNWFLDKNGKKKREEEEKRKENWTVYPFMRFQIAYRVAWMLEPISHKKLHNWLVPFPKVLIGTFEALINTNIYL